jgi:hypothetical protein
MIENEKHNPVSGSHWSWSLTALVLVLGMNVFLVASFAYPPAQFKLLATTFGLLAGLVVWQMHADRQRAREWSAVLNTMPIPFALAPVPGFFKEYARIAEALMKIAKYNDLLFRDLALTRIEAVADEVAFLARGQIVFNATETWRTVYQNILETLHVKTYYSVAWVRSNDYWNDGPGRQSMQLNYELAARGYRIERVHILSDELWPFDEKLPANAILNWLIDQQGRGIYVSIVRESDLSKEPELVRDFAVYGDRATGTQELDDKSHTLRFVLAFDETSIRQALVQWERLKLFASPILSRI